MQPLGYLARLVRLNWRRPVILRANRCRVQADLGTLGRVCSPGAVLRWPHQGWQHIAGAPLAQSAERLHGKEKVYGSIP